MDPSKLSSLIRRYEEVYVFGSRFIANMLTDNGLIDLTPEQYFVLRSLQEKGRSMPSDLAETCRVNRSAITSMVDRLVAKGYVRRIPDERDRRAVFLETTDAGKEVCNKGEENLLKYVASYFQDELEEEEIEAFIRTFEKIGEILKRKGG